MSSFFSEIKDSQIGPTTYQSTQYLGAAKGACCNNNIANHQPYTVLSKPINSCDKGSYASASNNEVVCGMTIDNMLEKQAFWSAGGFSSNAWSNAKNESCNRCPAVTTPSTQTLPTFPAADNRGFIFPHLDKANPTFDDNYPQTITDRPEERRLLRGEIQFGSGATCNSPDSTKSQMSYGVYQGPATSALVDAMESLSPLDGEPREIYGDTYVATGSGNASSCGGGPNSLFVQCKDSAALPYQTAAPSRLMWNPMPINNFLKSNYEVLKNNKSLSKITANAILNDSLSNSADLNTKLYRNVLSGDDPFMLEQNELQANCNNKELAGNVFSTSSDNQNNTYSESSGKQIIIQPSESNNIETEMSNQGSINLNATNLTDIPNKLVYGSESCCNINNYNVADPVAPEEMPYILKKSLFGTNQIKNPYGNAWTGSINNDIGVPYASSLNSPKNCVPNPEPMIQQKVADSNANEIKNNTSTIQNVQVVDEELAPGFITTFVEAWKNFIHDLSQANAMQHQNNNNEYILSNHHQKPYSCYIFTSFVCILFLIFLLIIFFYYCLKK